MGSQEQVNTLAQLLLLRVPPAQERLGWPWRGTLLHGGLQELLETPLPEDKVGWFAQACLGSTSARIAGTLDLGWE